MPIEPPDQKFFEAAHGYAELGMFHDANEQLEKIDPFLRAAPEILALRIEIYRGLQKWELMTELTRRLTEFEPDNPQWPVSLAYATRRGNSIEAAKQILLNAERRFPKEAVIPYNLGCYCCQLGDLEAAKKFLRRAFQIDPAWRLIALDDIDLMPLWEALAQMFKHEE